EEAGHDSYYLQDDLGSPMLLADEEGEIRESYAFDEFGQSLYHSPEGQLQPFGYTGYQMEEAGGLYFAQARRYDAEAGRFVSEDKVKGNAYLPVTINAYLYCRNQPLKYVDPSGNDCYYFYVPAWKHEAENDRRQLAEAYGLDSSQVHLVEVTDNQSLTDAWNAMGIENGNIVKIDAVVINTHGSPEDLAYKKKGGEYFTGIKIQALEDKNMGVLILYGCNAGHADFVGTNPASVFSQKVNGAPVLASDGTVYSGWTIFNWTDRNYSSRADKAFKKYVPNGTKRKNNGWLIYQYADGNVSVSQSLGKKMSISVMLEKIEDYVCNIA
ncbi:MAG: hypothetical protein HDQ99_19695, partial [Lachnospiraceae bacterium]|nr:hypothetical protein [Lachnospiraceae bacterium]